MRAVQLALLLVLAVPARAETVLVAVASNFAAPMEELAQNFERATGHEIKSSVASTGVLFAAISNGARYAALFAADEERPSRLEQSGLGIAGSRFTYAVGRLELVSSDPDLAGADCRAELDKLGSRRLAIANPVTAPYGLAAKAFLRNAGLWDRVADNVVYGQNIAQTLQFVVTRNATFGLVAAAQVGTGRVPGPACRWPVPTSLHEPIAQQAILLSAAAHNDAAIAFLDFVRSGEGRAIIRARGYETPD